MSEQQPEPDLGPRTSQVLAEPADVAACTRDYNAAADIRARLDEQIKGRR